MTLISSKLTSSCHNDHVFTVSYEYCAFTGSNKNKAVFRVVNVEIGCDVENKIIAVFAFIDVILLLFDGVYLFNFEGPFLVHKLIIIWVIFFLYRFFGFQNVRMVNFFFFHFHLRWCFFLNFVFVLYELLFSIDLDLNFGFFFVDFIFIFHEFFFGFGLFFLNFAGEYLV